MARSITTCQGDVITIGDKVRTEDGNVITVQGAAIGLKFYNAEKCTKVKDGDTHSHKVVEAAAVSDNSDCIIWGS